MDEPAIVTFIDILGFRELIEDRSAEDVGKIIDVFRERSGDPEGEDALGLTVVAFSDSIIRSRSQSVMSGVFYELLDLLHAQGDLLSNEVLVRGGVSCGKITIESDKVFGPAFIDAYDLESKFAVFPRIAVSPRLLRALARGEIPVANHHDLRTEMNYVRELLTQGDDGVWFIDYLRAFRSELDDPVEQYPLYLSKHQEIILSLNDSQKGAGGLSSLALKVNWLAKYHNTVVGELADGELAASGLSKTDLLVPHDALDTFFSFDT